MTGVGADGLGLGCGRGRGFDGRGSRDRVHGNYGHVCTWGGHGRGRDCALHIMHHGRYVIYIIKGGCGRSR